MNNLLDTYNSYIEDAVNEAATIYVITFLTVFFVLAGIMTAILVTTMLALKKRADGQKAVNDSLKNSITAFNPSKIFYFCDKSTYKKPDEYKQMLLVDSAGKRLGLIDYGKGVLNEVAFADVLNYEVYENGVQVIDGLGVGSFGVGAISMQSRNLIKELKLIIRMKSVDNPHTVYEIVSSRGILNFGIGKNSQIYRICFPTVQEAVSLLQVIADENKPQNN